MFGELQSRRNFLTLFSRLFGGQRSTTAIANQDNMTAADLAALSRRAQLLLAYILEQNNPRVVLLDSDTDASELLQSGWLKSLPCSQPGMIAAESPGDSSTQH